MTTLWILGGIFAVIGVARRAILAILTPISPTPMGRAGTEVMTLRIVVTDGDGGGGDSPRSGGGGGDGGEAIRKRLTAIEREQTTLRRRLGAHETSEKLRARGVRSPLPPGNWN